MKNENFQILLVVSKQKIPVIKNSFSSFLDITVVLCFKHNCKSAHYMYSIHRKNFLYKFFRKELETRNLQLLCLLKDFIK